MPDTNTIVPDSASTPPSLSPTTENICHNVPECATHRPLNPPSLTPDCPPPTGDCTLSPRQLTAISLLIAGRSTCAIAACLGLNRHTIARWKKDPAFASELQRRHAELWEQAHARLRQKLLLALDIIDRCLHDRRYGHDVDAAWKLIPILARSGSLAPPAPAPDPDSALDRALAPSKL